MRYEAIRSEGGLISYDVLDQIASGEMEGQKAADFGLPKGRRLADEISRVWSDTLHYWAIFTSRCDSLSDRDPYGTTLTRERWITPLLSDPELLAYELSLQPSGVEKEGRNYPISHRGGKEEDSPPVHIEGFKIDLDHKAPRLRTSPHSMMQTFLNVSEEDLWAIVTNGWRLRLVRDASHTSRPTYIEFDLRSIFEGNRFHEFALFYRLCHRTRLPQPGENPAQCILEKYYQHSIGQGGRVRDGLRDGVEQALKVLGTGFLQHPMNDALREMIDSKQLAPADFHRQLLMLVYRLLFLMVAEERGLLVSTGDDAERQQRIYQDNYSISRLRSRAEQVVEEGPYGDVWLGLQQTFALFEYGREDNPLGIPPLNGALFDLRATQNLNDAHLYNQDLLIAIRNFSLYTENKVQRRVNYAGLDVEELGSVYESLLDYRPVFAGEGAEREFRLEVGAERKSTGSYYTRPELVQELIKSALVPVMEDRLAEVEKQAAGESTEEKRKTKEAAILNITVCDPACGSGHFLLAAARRLGRELSKVRTGEEEPTPEQFHVAIRDVVTHCIYGVDLNPLAVDLCRLALWLEGHWVGKPLSFLDHRIKCGNSLIGVLDPGVLEKGIPDDAFKPVTGDDKKVASAYKKRNKKERETLLRRFDFEAEDRPSVFVASAELLDFAEDKPEDVRRKEELYRKGREQKDWWHSWTAANLWTSAFFLPLTRRDDPVVPTHETFMDYLLHNKDRPQMTGEANALTEQRSFFHWHVEFPDVFEKGGFDVVLGNPPWDVLQPEEVKFFAAAGAPEISNLPGAKRKAAIEKLPQTNPQLAELWHAYQRNIETGNKFIREGERFERTAVGKLNTYSLFAELTTEIIGETGRAGIIVQSGIATDDSNKDFFATLSDSRSLVSLFDFENREKLFPDVDSRMKFCLLTIARTSVAVSEFAFFCTNTAQLRDQRRRFTLVSKELALLNPNTLTCPIFRTRADAELTKKIYRGVPVLINEAAGENPWGVQFQQGLFNMTSDSHLFKTEPGPGLLPLYEAKMIHQFDHRWATYENGETRDCTPVEKADPHFTVRPRYWVPEEEVEGRLGDWNQDWLLGFRRNARTNDERTFIAAIMPTVGAGDSIFFLFVRKSTANESCCLLANLNALVFDYLVRQKLGGMNMSFYIVNQLPVLPKTFYSEGDASFVSNRVVELVYTAKELAPFARISENCPRPFCWDKPHRAKVRAELDAYIAHLYGLTRDELRYILDPKDVFGEDFPGETFRVLQEKEEKAYGEYRTRRLVLAAYDELAKSDRFAGEKRESAIEAPRGRSMVSVK